MSSVFIGRGVTVQNLSSDTAFMADATKLGQVSLFECIRLLSSEPHSQRNVDLSANHLIFSARPCCFLALSSGTDCPETGPCDLLSPYTRNSRNTPHNNRERFLLYLVYHGILLLVLLPLWPRPLGYRLLSFLGQSRLLRVVEGISGL